MIDAYCACSPISPESMDWSTHYPAFVEPKAHVESEGLKQDVKAESEEASASCELERSTRHPLTRDEGLEIRVSVTEFVENKIRALRQQSLLPTIKAATDTPDGDEPAADRDTNITLPLPDAVVQDVTPLSPFQNISVLRANTMKFLPNLFHRAQLQSIFLCFPDPHFKARKHKARIVSATLCSEYAYVLQPEGKVYTITDVEDLHLWMAGHFKSHKSFETVSEVENESDELVSIMKTETEEGKKVERSGGQKFVAVFRRLPDPPWPGEDDA
ncbi:hypothetical protein MRB53_037371 [Persea americana]|nr:hypothetical protein MRB53_037371 [Persea americana]